MDRTVIDYSTNLVHGAPFTPVPTLSTGSKQTFKIGPHPDEGTLHILKFDSRLTLILTANFTPDEIMEKITEVSERYLRISQFETKSSSFKIGGRELSNIGKGIYCYLNIEKKAYTYCGANKPVEFTKIILTKEYLDTPLKSKYDDFEYEKAKILNSYLLKTQSSPQLNFIFQQVREPQAEGKILPLYLESKVMGLLSIIIAELEGREKNISVVLTKKDKQNLEKAVSAMKKDLSVRIDGLELSKVASMSPAQFRLAFRRCYGVPPYEHLKELRLNRASLLLKNLEHKISMIVGKVGYTHTGHSARTLKSTHGITPSRYRSMLNWRNLSQCYKTQI